VQHPRSIADAARIHRHVDDLLLDLRQETGRGVSHSVLSYAPLERGIQKQDRALLGAQSRLALHRPGVYNAPLPGVADRPAEEKVRLFFPFANYANKCTFRPELS
jgi:hypothetical protein